MQRRQLNGNARPPRQRRVAGVIADRLDRTRVGMKIFLGVGRGARAFAQHVERVAEIGMAASARQRLLDGLAEHEMRADEPHGLPRRRAHGRQAEAADDGVEDGFRRFARMNDARRDAERPGRGRNQNRVGFYVAVEPAAGGELVLDQAVGGGGVRHAQQRLGQHHEREAFLGGERIGVEKILDAAETVRLGADRLDELARARIDATLGGAVARGLGEETRRQLFVRRA